MGRQPRTATEMYKTMKMLNPTRWAHLRPDDFKARQARCPVVYLPFGLCEPHGHVAALGLDTLKADYFCEQAAARFGGIVAPTQGYHIHECGFHGPWLEDVVGDTNAMMAGMPPHVVCHHFLYQLRAFANAGFRAVVAVSGHGGGSQNDLRRVAKAFSEATKIPVIMRTDPEFTDGAYEGDHAGAYELSQLMAIHPGAVDLSLIDRQHEAGSDGRLALGDDAAASSVEAGHTINEAVIAGIGRAVAALELPEAVNTPIDYDATESIWRKVLERHAGWYSEQINPSEEA